MTTTRRRVARFFKILVSGWTGPAPRPEKWAFIVGCTNSGTALLHTLLASHPDIGSMPREGQSCTDQLLIPKRVGLPRQWALDSRRFYLDESSEPTINVPRLQKQWGGHFIDPNRPVLLEKSPPNALRTRWLEKHFPRAHFIGIIRDGYVTAKRIQRKTGATLAEAARQWARGNGIMLRDFERLKNARTITYERLVIEPDQVIGELLDFLGLRPLDKPLSNRAWNVHRQIRPIENDNPGVLAGLTAEERAVIESEAGDLLDRLGYRR